MNSSKMESVLSRRVFRVELATWLVVASSVLYSAIFSFFTLYKHYCFMTYAYDLGVFAQAFYTTLFEGKLFYQTPEIRFFMTKSFFGIHFSPIMFLLLPIYALYPSAENLLVFQSVILGFAAIPLYMTAKELTGNRQLSLIIALLYLFYPPTHITNVDDFHLEALVPIIVFSAFYYYFKGRRLLYMLFIFLLTITIDFTIILALFIGIYIVIRNYEGVIAIIRGQKVDSEVRADVFLGFSTVVFSLIMGFVAVKTISSFGPPPLKESHLFPIFGSNLQEISRGFLDPRRVYHAIRFDFFGKITYILLLFVPLLFLPLLGLYELIMCIPWISLIMLTQYSYLYQYGSFHAGGFFGPFAILAALAGAKKLLELNYSKATRILHTLFVFGLIISLILTPLNPFIQRILPGIAYMDYPKPSPHYRYIEEALKLIPKDATVYVQSNVFPHICDRLNVYVWLPPDVEPEYALADIRHRDFYLRVINQRFSKVFEDMLRSGEYGLMVCADGVMLIKKGYKGEPILTAPYSVVYDGASFPIVSGGVIYDTTSKYGRVAVHHTIDPKEVPFWFGPYVALPPGNYIATFRIKIDQSASAYLLTLDIASDKGRVILGRRYLYGFEIEPGKWTNITVAFSMDELWTDVEFRGMRVSNFTNIYFDYVEIRQIEEPLWTYTYNFYDLDIENGWVKDGILRHEIWDSPGVFWRGPNATLSPGRYRVSFLMKVSSVSGERVIRLEVAVGGEVVESREVYASEFADKDWRWISMDFELDRQVDDVEFRGVDVCGNCTVELAYILVERVVK